MENCVFCEAEVSSDITYFFARRCPMSGANTHVWFEYEKVCVFDHNHEVFSDVYFQV